RSVTHSPRWWRLVRSPDERSQGAQNRRLLENGARATGQHAQPLHERRVERLLARFGVEDRLLALRAPQREQEDLAWRAPSEQRERGASRRHRAAESGLARERR